MRVGEGTAVIHHSADLMSDGDTSAAALSLSSTRFTKKKKKKGLCSWVTAAYLVFFYLVFFTPNKGVLLFFCFVFLPERLKLQH